MSKMISLLVSSSILVFSSAAFAGTWTCDLGLDGNQIMNLKVSGDAQGNLQAPANIKMAGMFGGSYSVMMDEAASDELVRAIIGQEDPRSKLRLRIMKEQTAVNTHVGYSLLMNFSIKQEFSGQCQFSQ